MVVDPVWNEPNESQSDHLDETFTLTEMREHFRKEWNRGNAGYWRVWGNTCEEALMELESLRAEVRELKARAGRPELDAAGV